VSTQTINASQNPGLANQLIKEVSKETTPEKPKAAITPPSDTVVTLPGGYVTADGEVITEAEVRELNGRDEEAIAKATTVGKVLTGILTRGTVSIGGLEATEELLDQMFAGDRDALLLGIYKATFGADAELDAYCSGCEDYKAILVNVDEDIRVVKLSDPIADRKFVVKGRSSEYVVILPNGKIQKELLLNSDKTLAELTTILLEGTVREINGSAVFTKAQVQDIGLVDRRKIADELTNRAFGPVFEEVKVACPTCDGEVVAPINLGALFRQ
jgi:hypothetical protein